MHTFFELSARQVHAETKMPAVSKRQVAIGLAALRIKLLPIGKCDRVASGQSRWKEKKRIFRKQHVAVYEWLSDGSRYIRGTVITQSFLDNLPAVVRFFGTARPVFRFLQHHV